MSQGLAERDLVSARARTKRAPSGGAGPPRLPDEPADLLRAWVEDIEHAEVAEAVEQG